jgi:hypothetical protein
VVALPAVLVIAALVLIAGIGIASSGFWASSIGAGDNGSKIALAIAEAGAEDAFLRVVRNKQCNTGGTPACDAYTLTFPLGAAEVTVAGIAPKTILSQGVVGSIRRKVQVEVAFDANDKATQTSWKEVTN